MSRLGQGMADWLAGQIRQQNQAYGWMPAVGLLVLAAASAWLAHALHQDTLLENPQASADLPDYTMENFVSTALDTQGKIIRQFQGLRMEHYPTADAWVSQPYLVTYDDMKPVWYIRAESARVPPEGDKVWLLGDVYFWQYTSVNNVAERRAEIITRDVLLKPAQDYAETAAPVRIVSPQGVTESVGMRAHMPTRQVELLSKVRGHYENKYANPLLGSPDP